MAANYPRPAPSRQPKPHQRPVATRTYQRSRVGLGGRAPQPAGPTRTPCAARALRPGHDVATEHGVRPTAWHGERVSAVERCASSRSVPAIRSVGYVGSCPVVNLLARRPGRLSNGDRGGIRPVAITAAPDRHSRRHNDAGLRPAPPHTRVVEICAHYLSLRMSCVSRACCTLSCCTSLRVTAR